MTKPPKAHKKPRPFSGGIKMNHRCTLCNYHCSTIPYKGGYICEECLNNIRCYGVQDSGSDD